MKNLLIISHNSLSKHANNGKTITSLFDHRRNEDIAQLYFQDEIPESDTIQSFYRIRDIDVVNTMLTNKKTFGSKVTPVSAVNSHRNNKQYIEKIITIIKTFEKTKLLIREILYEYVIRKLDYIDFWIKEIEPDALFLVGSNYPFIFKFVRRISTKYDIPAHVFFTDDYVLNFQSRNWFERRIHQRLIKQVTAVIQTSKSRFVISEDMAINYTNKFKSDFHVLANGIDLNEVPIAKNYRFKAKIKIVYAGGLTLGRDEMLFRFMSYTRKVSTSIGVEVTLTLYSHNEVIDSTRKRYETANIIFGGAASQSNLKKELENADYLIHVESDLQDNIRRTMWSFSTKIPEYLATGVCVIAFGPTTVSSIRILRDNKIGFVIDSEQHSRCIENRIRCLMTTPEDTNILTENAVKYVYENFNKKIQSKLIDNTIFGGE